MDEHRKNAFTLTVSALAVIALIMLLVTGNNILNLTKPTASDPEKTAAPTVVSETAPAVTEAPHAVSYSGSFLSPRNEKLGLRVDWSISSEGTDRLVLDIAVYLRSYTIRIGPCDGVIRVCGQEYPFTSGGVELEDDNYQHDTLLYSTLIDLPAKPGETIAVPIAVGWEYNGMYAEMQFGTIRADETVTVEW